MSIPQASSSSSSYVSSTSNIGHRLSLVHGLEGTALQEAADEAAPTRPVAQKILTSQARSVRHAQGIRPGKESPEKTGQQRETEEDED